MIAERQRDDSQGTGAMTAAAAHSFGCQLRVCCCQSLSLPGSRCPHHDPGHPQFSRNIMQTVELGHCSTKIDTALIKKWRSRTLHLDCTRPARVSRFVSGKLRFNDLRMTSLVYIALVVTGDYAPRVRVSRTATSLHKEGYNGHRS